MYFKYDKINSIEVPEPFCRIMTPLMCTDTTDGRDLPFSVHYTEWMPGRKVDTHAHDEAVEAMYCISGSGKGYVDGECFDLVPHSMIVADKGEVHSIVNTGDEMLRVLCIFSPPVSGEGLRTRAMEAVENYNLSIKNSK